MAGNGARGDALSANADEYVAGEERLGTGTDHKAAFGYSGRACTRRAERDCGDDLAAGGRQAAERPVCTGRKEPAACNRGGGEREARQPPLPQDAARRGRERRRDAAVASGVIR